MRRFCCRRASATRRPRSCQAGTPGQVGRRRRDADAWRIEVDVGQTRHGRPLHQIPALSCKPPVVRIAQQYMRRPTAIDNEDGPRFRSFFCPTNIFVQLTACHGRDSHGLSPEFRSHVATCCGGMPQSKTPVSSAPPLAPCLSLKDPVPDKPTAPRGVSLAGFHLPDGGQVVTLTRPSGIG